MRTPPLAKPPGPTGWLIGRAARAFRKTPAEFLLELAREYGDVVYFRAGFQKYYLLNRPDLIEEVLETSPASFQASAIFPADATGDGERPDPGVITEAVNREALVRRATAAVECALAAQTAWQSGETRDMHEELTRITGAIASRETFSPVTAAAALTWTLYLLAQNPGVAGRLHDELDRVLGGRLPSFEDLPQLSYAEMVLSETLRIYPPVWALARTVRRHYRLYNYGLSPGSICLVSPYVMQRHPRYYPDPERFKPERFTPDEQQSRPRFAWFPFGHHLTGSVDERSVFLEGMLVLATLLQGWRSRLAEVSAIEPHSVADLRPRGGLPMVLEK